MSVPPVLSEQQQLPVLGAEHGPGARLRLHGLRGVLRRHPALPRWAVGVYGPSVPDLCRDVLRADLHAELWWSQGAEPQVRRSQDTPLDLLDEGTVGVPKGAPTGFPGGLGTL